MIVAAEIDKNLLNIAVRAIDAPLFASFVYFENWLASVTETFVCISFIEMSHPVKFKIAILFHLI